MKTLLLILFISLLSSPSWCEEMSDLVKREGIYYQKFTDVPFTGEVNGQEQGTMKNGGKEGFWIRYHKNGQLWDKGKFHFGEREGAWVYYEQNGTVTQHWTGTYKYGEKISD